MKKRILITISFIVDEDNVAGARKFQDTLSGFLHQLKRDFNGDIQSFDGRLETSDAEEQPKAVSK